MRCASLIDWSWYTSRGVHFWSRRWWGFQLKAFASTDNRSWKVGKVSRQRCYFALLIFTPTWNELRLHCYRPFLCHSDSLWCPHSKADTVTRLFGAVKVDSFAQGFLQHKEETNEYLAAANPNQERQIDFLRAWESLGSFYLKFRSLSFLVKIITLGDSLLLIFSLHI